LKIDDDHVPLETRNKHIVEDLRHQINMFANRESNNFPKNWKELPSDELRVHLHQLCLKLQLDTTDGNKNRNGTSLEAEVTNLEFRWGGFAYPIDFLTTLRGIIRLHKQEWDDLSEVQRKQLMLTFVKESIFPRLVDKEGKHLLNIIAKDLESLIKDNKIKEFIPVDDEHRYLDAAENATDIYSFLSYTTADIVTYFAKYRDHMHMYCDPLKPPKSAGNKQHNNSDTGTSNGGNNPNRHPQQQKPHNKNTNSDSGSTPAKHDNNKRPACRHCGETNHSSKSCYLRDYHPDANKADCAWVESESYKVFDRKNLWKDPNHKVLPGNLTSDGNPWKRPAACTALMNEAREKAKQGKQLNHLSQNDITNDIFLPVDIHINDKHRQEGALMDFGAISGNYINVDLHDWLKEQGAIVTPCSNPQVCSAFTGICSKCHGKVNIVIRIKCDSGDYLQMNLTVSVIDSPYALIIGRPAIKRYDLTLLVRSHFTSNYYTELDSETKCHSKLNEFLNGLVSTEWCSPCTEPTPNTHVDSKKVSGQPTPRAFGSNNVEAALNHINAIYRKEDLIDIIDDDSDDPFWKDDITSLLPDKNKSNPDKLELPVIEGETPFHDDIRKLLREYSDVFSRTVSKTPAKVPPMELNLDFNKWQNDGSHRGPPRPQTPAKQQAVLDSLKKLLEAGVIRPSQASEYSQILLVPKPDGSWRFCVDYRALNALLTNMGWPLPNIDRLLRRLGAKRAKYFAVLDLTAGYHQVLLSENSRRFAAFITDFGVFEPVRISMGLKTAPAYFQQQIALMLHQLIHDICELYIDDVIIYGQSEKDFLQNLRTVLKRMREYNITLHPDKAKIGFTELEYVGHVITQKWMGMSDAKINKILDFPLPKKGKQLKSFLGLANYFREHIQNYASLSYPLHQLILDYDNVRHKHVHWTVEAVRQYETLREAISKCPKLYFMVDDAPTFLDTDASDYGIGAYLYQIIEGEKKPIAFLSKTLSKIQQRWSTIEKECYAIWYALRHWEFLLRDIFFTIRTDHRNLKYLNTNTPKVVRWKLAVQEYNFQVEDIKGPTNVIADAFSRLCAEEDDESQRVPTTSQVSEPEVVATTLQSFKIPGPFYKKISSVHNTRQGHFGVELTMKKLKELYPTTTWLRMRAHVQQFIRQCPVCQKLSAIKVVITTKPFTTATYAPMERISLDSLGPLPTSNGYVYVLVIIDNFTRFVDLYPCKSTGAKEAAQHILQHCGRFGTPLQILSDAGTQFLNELVDELLEIMGPEKIEGLPGSKEENSIVERSIKEVLRHLRAFLQDTNVLEDWVTYLPLVQRIINATTHESIGVSPAQLLFGNAVHLDRNLVSAAHVAPSDNNTTYQQWTDKMLATQSKLIDIAVNLQKKKDNEHLRSFDGIPTEFPINSYVLIQYPKTAFGHKPPTKLHANWQGPFRVVNNIGSVYTVQDLNKFTNRDVHVSLLKQYQFDPAHTDPAKVALTDKQNFLVEAIRKHHGTIGNKATLEFEVKWDGYPETENTMLPWKELIHNKRLHDYLRLKKLYSWIPKDYRTEQDDELITQNGKKSAGRKRKWSAI
jgi:hypothetical protein